jgi:hypothetical protein
MVPAWLLIRDAGKYSESDYAKTLENSAPSESGHLFAHFIEFEMVAPIHRGRVY